MTDISTDADHSSFANVLSIKKKKALIFWILSSPFQCLYSLQWHFDVTDLREISGRDINIDKKECLVFQVHHERKLDCQQSKFTISEDEFRLPSGGFRANKPGQRAEKFSLHGGSNWIPSSSQSMHCKYVIQWAFYWVVQFANSSQTYPDFWVLVWLFGWIFFNLQLVLKLPFSLFLITQDFCSIFIGFFTPLFLFKRGIKMCWIIKSDY